VTAVFAHAFLAKERVIDLLYNECTVEEQIAQTDIRKIPQIVWAESGSLTVPV
jgi:hypothetical protein